MVDLVIRGGSTLAGGAVVAIIIVAVIILVIAISCIKIVPQATTFIVERFGGYRAT